MTKNKIIEKLNTLQYKDDSIVLTDVYPSKLEKIFNIDDICILGGKNLNYEFETSEYSFNGSAYYGSCTVTKKNGELNTIHETINRYTRTSFEHYGIEIDNIPPAIIANDQISDKIKIDKSYDVFYICFSQNCITTLKTFYAKNRIDVINRALSIWGRYDDIKTAEEIRTLYKKFDNYFYKFYKIDKEILILQY